MSSRTYLRRFAATSVLALLTFSFATSADGVMAQSCETRDRTFETELAAVYALSTCYAARSAEEDREYFAAILRTPDGFVFVVSAGSKGVDQVSLRFKPLRGESFVALWHTHGASGPYRELFSPTDTALVNDVHVPFYLADTDGRPRVFRAGDEARAFRDHRTNRSPPRGAAEGTVLPLRDELSGRSLASLDQ